MLCCLIILANIARTRAKEIQQPSTRLIASWMCFTVASSTVHASSSPETGSDNRFAPLRAAFNHLFFFLPSVVR